MRESRPELFRDVPSADEIVVLCVRRYQRFPYGPDILRATLIGLSDRVKNCRSTKRYRDFFTIEVWTTKGLQRFLVLLFIELPTRRVEIAGISASASGLWMNQIARNVTDLVDGLLTGKRYLIHDRDPLFTHEFLRTLKNAGVQSVKLPPRART